MTPTLVVVSGPPGTGKTTLAHELARAIPCAAICRDEIKEGVVHSGLAGDLQPVANRIFFAVLAELLDGGASVVAEAAFQHRLWHEGLERLPAADLRVVQCVADVDVVYARVFARLRPAHEPGPPPAWEEWSGRFASFERLAVQAPSLEVDTTEGYAPALGTVASFARRSVSSSL